MDSGSIWRAFLASWPDGAAQMGVVVMTSGEQIPFSAFLISDNVVMLERPAPDTVGARKIVLPYSHIDAIKITEPIDNDVFVAAGFASVKPKSSRK